MRPLVPILVTVSASLALGQTISPNFYQGLQWRGIGPYRGGRTTGIAAVPSAPNEFYIGVCNGGVWKTTDFGQTWKPVFDSAPTGSVGAVAVAPSDPNTLYVGSGEALQRPDLSVGDGVYKSTDGGKTWQNMGLKDGEQITAIIVDPQDANRLFVSVLGHPYGPNEERGVFRSTDGGATWRKVLYKDSDTGAAALAFDPTNSQILYADLWAARQAPWENGEWQGAESGLFKSTDGGNTWIQVGSGLPTAAQNVGRIGFSICASNPSRIYAVVDAQNGGLYRSEDAGATWALVNPDRRLWGRGSDFAEVRADPRDQNTVYIANTCTYKSTDGGKTFAAWKGAPGGDDYHTIWVNPKNPKIIVLASDQGATITVNGGETWSSWYNQPTAQFYHVATDDQFPYWVYGGQQESGSAMVCSRGNDGEINFREWHPVGAEEYGYIAPDPLNADLVFGGKVSKFDKVTGQVQDVSPPDPDGKYRFLRTAPLLFSPVDPHTLYLAGNVLFKSEDEGSSWKVISPDLSRKNPDVPDCVGVYKTQTPKVEQRGVIYAVGPGYKSTQVIWAGTDDGLVHFTRDGGQTWANVTPPEMHSWYKVSQIDAGRFDEATAYIAVNCLRLDDLKPYAFKTHDWGKTWTPIIDGLPDDAPVNVVREDPLIKGLLYCGTEHAVYFSTDDGAHWNPLRQNMPATSIRDLVVHANDLVVGTHGRGFWILDDIVPLRQLARGLPNSPALFKPETAYRYRRDTNSDTPLPPEVPAGQNPPDGAILDYYLPSQANGPVVLEIYDSNDRLVRRYSSNDKPDPVNPEDLEIPTYWIRPFQPLSASAGEHRFVWDLYWQPNGYVPFYPISAVYHDTPPVSTSPLAAPGAYTLNLIVDGRTYAQSFNLKLDPRIKTPLDGIQRQSALVLGCYDMEAKLMAESKKRGEKPAPRRRFGQRGIDNSLSALAQAFGGLIGEIDSSDMAPTMTMEEEYRELTERAKRALGVTSGG